MGTSARDVCAIGHKLGIFSLKILANIQRMSQKTQRKTSKKKGKKSKKKNVVVEVDLTSDKAKNDMIQALLAKTELGEEELNEAYDDFYQVYPGGEISEQEFLQISKAGVMAQSLFRVFDEDNSGKLTFYEFVQANNVKNLRALRTSWAGCLTPLTQMAGELWT